MAAHAPEHNRLVPRRWLQRWAGRLKALGLGSLLLASAGIGARAAETPFTEAQVKALFLLNFAKYVDWPREVFAQADAPLTIGVIGDPEFRATLEKTVAGKSVGGRSIVVRPEKEMEDFSKCQILFIRGTEKKHLADILTRVKGKPVLTVGEAEHFLDWGGIIGFAKKEGKVRLQIDLKPARETGMQISAKLLSVADVVRGKS